MAYLDHRGNSSNPLVTYDYGGNLARFKHALTRVFSDAYQDSRSEALYLFGYPGGGKSSLVDSALQDLIDTTKQHMDVVEINCGKLIGEHPDSTSALGELHRVRAKYLKSLPALRVFVLDETDAIGLARHLPGASAMISMCFFCITSLRRKDKHVAWLLITNNPELVDPAIVNPIGKRLYIPSPDKEAAEVVCKEALRSKDAERLVDKLAMPDREFALNVRALVDGLGFLGKCGNIRAKHFYGCDPMDAADKVEAGGGFPPKNEVSEYEDKYRVLINQSRLLLKAYGI